MGTFNAFPHAAFPSSNFLFVSRHRVFFLLFTVCLSFHYNRRSFLFVHAVTLFSVRLAAWKSEEFLFALAVVRMLFRFKAMGHGMTHTLRTCMRMKETAEMMRKLPFDSAGTANGNGFHFNQVGRPRHRSFKWAANAYRFRWLCECDRLIGKSTQTRYKTIVSSID